MTETETVEPPTVLCEEIEPSRPGGVRTWRFWCQYCRRYHTHGAMPGHRVAHCSDERSPFYERGYILKKRVQI